VFGLIWAEPLSGRKKEKLKQDIYQKVTAKIIEALEKGVWPWSQPWNAEHVIGRITRPLRANGVPYQGSFTPLFRQ
jgi:antirestriction protein ArdC